MEWAQSFGGFAPITRHTATARALGVTLQSNEVRGPKDVEVAFAKMAEERLDALLIRQDELTASYHKV
jgi:hypothetical protein